MKNINKILLGACGAMMLLSSCTSILEEHPKNKYTPEFFTTPAGIEGGLTALYSHYRMFGQHGPFNSGSGGTDEATYAESADGGFKLCDYSGAAAAPSGSNSIGGEYWSFSYINTANGIIENAEAVNLAPSLIAEARFFRAFDYFNMVRSFGGVPLDLGSGELAFNRSAVRTSTRNTVPEVYGKCIFPDLEYAVENLPEKGRLSGAVTKTAARILLSKAYLTFGWWLENPKGIATYPECDRKALDGKSAQQYYQMAYNMAVEGINNPGPFGLMPYFYQVNDGAYDRQNTENVFYADHTENSQQYNGSDITGMNTNGSSNMVSWAMTWNYPGMTAKATLTDGSTKNINPVLRTDAQVDGRPWTRMAPTHEALKIMTENHQWDSRADGTFCWTLTTNWTKDNNFKNVEYVDGPNGAQIKMGERFLVFLMDEDPTVEYTFASGKGMMGVSPNYDYYVINPSGVSRLNYPSLWKYGPYRTNTSGIGEPNCGSTRPFPILRFSELYLTAAEAAFKLGNNDEARNKLNVLRARAGKWIMKEQGRFEYVADFSKELTDATPETITIDFILDEAMRENYGSCFRWFELVRTQTLIERAGQYTICGAAQNDRTPAVTKRIYENYHYLRPIPKSQMDGMLATAAEKNAYQNPGYTKDFDESAE